jgi:hypothetical protein
MTMRFDTHRISAFLVSEVQKARPYLEVEDDGGDIIHVRAQSGDLLAIYLVEEIFMMAHVRDILTENTALGIYTVFILWQEFLLPAHGTRYRPDDWMQSLISLHGNKIYGYDPYAGDDMVFPIYFDRDLRSHTCSVRHGEAIEAARLRWDTVHVTAGKMRGTWRIADFEAGKPIFTQPDPLQAYYDVLGIERRTTRAAVKRAYRRLARKYHPDVNSLDGADDMMRRLNEAYVKVIETFEP